MRPTAAVRALIFVCVWAVTLSSAGASAQWLANGTAVMPGFLDGSSLSIAPDLAGGAYAVTGDGTYDARANHLLGTGDFAAGWNSHGTRFSTGPFRPFVPIVIADGAGGAFVISNVQNCAAHCTNDPTELRVQHVTLEGKLVEGWPLEGISIGSGLWNHYGNPAGSQPVSILNGRGSAIITWARQQTFARGTTPNPVELRVQRVDGDGAMPWGEGGILIHAFAARRYDQVMAPDGTGGAFVFWLDDRAPGVYAQHITEAGKILWAADGIPVATTPFIGLGRPAAVPDGAHGAIVAWSGTSGGRTGIFAARVTPSGSLPWRGAGEVFRAGSSQLDGLRMVPARAGGAVLAWRASQTGANDRILAQRLDHAGRREWRESAVIVCAAIGTRDHVALASDRRGGAYVAWLDSRPAFGIFATHLERTGEPARGWPSDGAPVCSRLPLPMPEDGLIAFSALEITTVDAPEMSEGKRDLDDAGDSEAQGAIGEAEQLGALNEQHSNVHDNRLASHMANAMLAWVDDRTPLEAGSHFTVPSPFAMLLTPRGPATAPIAAFQLPILVNQPEYSRVAFPAPSFSLGRPRAAGQQIVRMSLPDASPASLELFDLAGRRLWSRDVGGLGPGVHDVSIGDATYPSGIYMARLTQGRSTARAHVAVIH